jgi:ribonuclease HI
MPTEESRAQAWTDGGGQLGDECACACVIEFEGRSYERARRLGNTVTHNVAEYQGVILAIGYALKLGVRRLDIYSDSQLIVGQIDGTKRTRKPHLKLLREAVCTLLENFDSYSIEWIPRAENKRADKLCRDELRRATRGS